jgi:hypothetical protein
VDKPQSLADFLGVQDSLRLDESVQPAFVKMTAKAFSKEILDTAQYRESLLRRILMDQLPAAVECLLYHYAYGKPVESIEIKDVTDPLDDFTAEQCEEHAQRLIEVARQLRHCKGEQGPVH